MQMSGQGVKSAKPNEEKKNIMRFQYICYYDSMGLCGVFVPVHAYAPNYTLTHSVIAHKNVGIFN